MTCHLLIGSLFLNLLDSERKKRKLLEAYSQDWTISSCRDDFANVFPPLVEMSIKGIGNLRLLEWIMQCPSS